MTGPSSFSAKKEHQFDLHKRAFNLSSDIGQLWAWRKDILRNLFRWLLRCRIVRRTISERKDLRKHACNPVLRLLRGQNRKHDSTIDADRFESKKTLILFFFSGEISIKKLVFNSLIKARNSRCKFSSSCNINLMASLFWRLIAQFPHQTKISLLTWNYCAAADSTALHQ